MTFWTLYPNLQPNMHWFYLFLAILIPDYSTMQDFHDFNEEHY